MAYVSFHYINSVKVFKHHKSFQAVHQELTDTHLKSYGGDEYSDTVARSSFCSPYLGLSHTTFVKRGVVGTKIDNT